MIAAKFKVESGVQLLARLSRKQDIENFYPDLFQGGLKHGDIVEIISNDISSYLLIDLISYALIPTNTDAESVGVLVFNTAGQFNFNELIKSLQKRIHFMNNLDKQEIERDRVLQQILCNFFLLEIYDPAQFYTTIHTLDNILIKHPNISLVLFDTLTAFYWAEQGFKIIKMDVYVKNLLRIIQKVSKEYKVMLVYTRPAYFTSSKDIEFQTSEIIEGINFKVQVVDNNKNYEVNVKTLDSYYKKYFNILDSNIIKWG